MHRLTLPSSCPGPVGVAIEAADRPIVRFVAGLLADRIARRIAQDDGASG